MEIPEGLRRVFVGVLFMVASFFAFLGFGMWLGTPGGYHESLVEKLMPLASVLFAVLLAKGIAWLLRQPGSTSAATKPSVLKFSSILGYIALGAFVMFVIVWHRYLVALFGSR